MRQGERTVSWYHGPLIPAENKFEPQLPARAADELTRYDTAVGLLDVSYAAAWELGRLLALQSKQFSVRLYNWKRAHAQRLKQYEQSLLHPHLPTSEREPQAESLPDLRSLNAGPIGNDALHRARAACAVPTLACATLIRPT